MTQNQKTITYSLLDLTKYYRGPNLCKYQNNIMEFQWDEKFYFLFKTDKIAIGEFVAGNSIPTVTYYDYNETDKVDSYIIKKLVPEIEK